MFFKFKLASQNCDSNSHFTRGSGQITLDIDMRFLLLIFGVALKYLAYFLGCRWNRVHRSRKFYCRTAQITLENKKTKIFQTIPDCFQPVGRQLKNCLEVLLYACTIQCYILATSTTLILYLCAAALTCSLHILIKNRKFSSLLSDSLKIAHACAQCFRHFRFVFSSL
jgi:hypothetical protein